MGSKRHQKHRHDRGDDARRAQSALDRGRNALTRGDLPEALQELTTACKGLQSEAARDALLEATRRAAPDLVRSADGPARELLRQAVELAPRDPELRFHLARACWTAGALEESASALDPLLAHAGRAPSARLALSLIRARQGLADVAAKLCQPGRTGAGPDATEDDPASQERMLVELALALEARSTSALESIAAQSATARERDQMLYSVSTRRDGAARAFLAEARSALDELLDESRKQGAVALAATGAVPDRLPSPDVRRVLEPLIVEFERRLDDASTVRSPRTASWASGAARVLRGLGGDMERGEAAELPAGAPPDLALALALARTAAEGEPARALDTLLARADELPRVAARALAEALLVSIGESGIGAERLDAVSRRWPELADRFHAALAGRALSGERYAEALDHLQRVSQPAPRHRLQRAFTLTLAGRLDEAAPLWQALLDISLGRDASAGLPPWFQVALESYARSERSSTAEVERLLRRALAVAPGSSTVRILLAGTLLEGGSSRDRRAAAEVLEAVRPSKAEEACELARLWAAAGRADRALGALAALAASDRPADFARRVDAALRGRIFAVLPDEAEIELLDAADRLRPPSARQLLKRADLLEGLDRDEDASDVRCRALRSADPASPEAIDVALAVLRDEDLAAARELLRAVPLTSLMALELPRAAEVLSELVVDPLCADRWTRLKARLAACPGDAQRLHLLVLTLVEILEVEEHERYRSELLELATRIGALRRLGPSLAAAVEELAQRDFRLPDARAEDAYIESVDVLFSGAERVRGGYPAGQWCRTRGDHHDLSPHDGVEGGAQPDDTEDSDRVQPPWRLAATPRSVLERLAAEAAVNAPAAAPSLADALGLAVQSVAARAVGLEA